MACCWCTLLICYKCHNPIEVAKCCDQAGNTLDLVTMHKIIDTFEYSCCITAFITHLSHWFPCGLGCVYDHHNQTGVSQWGKIMDATLLYINICFFTTFELTHVSVGIYTTIVCGIYDPSEPTYLYSLLCTVVHCHLNSPATGPAHFHLLQLQLYNLPSPHKGSSRIPVVVLRGLQ